MASNKPPLVSGKFKVRELQAVQGYNLLTYSEEFQRPDPAWGKHNCSVVQNAIIAPTNTLIGDKIIVNNGSRRARLSQGIKPAGYTGQIPLNVPYTFSMYLSPGEFKFVGLRVVSVSSIAIDNPNVDPNEPETYTDFRYASHFTGVFDLTAGLCTNQFESVSGTFLDYSISKTENGWLRLSVTGIPNKFVETFTLPASSTVRALIIPLTGATDAVYTNSPVGNGSDGLYVWGAQLERNTKPSAYVTTLNQPQWLVYKYGGQAGNLIWESENFTSNTSLGWLRTNIGNVISAAEIAPNGLLVASKILENTTNGQHRLRHEASSPNNGQYTISIFAKKAERRYLQMSIEGSTVPSVFDLQTGTVVQVGDFTEPFIENYGAGWYRCSVTYEKRQNDIIMSFGPTNSTTAAPYAGSTTSGIFVWGAQAERTAWAGEPVKTAGAPYTRVSHYDFSSEETLEPAMTMPFAFNHLYWSDLFYDTKSTWTKTAAAVVSADNNQPVSTIITGTSLTAAATRLIEGTGAGNSTGWGILQPHEIRNEWDISYDGRYTFSIFARNNTRRYLRLDLDGETVNGVRLGRASLVVDLQTGSLTQSVSGSGYAYALTGKSESVTGAAGWYRISITGFFGIPNNLISDFSGDPLQTFAGEDMETFAQVLKDFDIRPVKRITPRITLSNGTGFSNINYTGNGSSAWIYGAQLQEGPTATQYVSNTTGKKRSYSADVTRIKPDVVHYFPMVRFANDEVNFRFLQDATYDKTRRTTGKETLIVYNNKIGYNNTNPTFTFDISGSLRALSASTPTLSTTRLQSPTSLNIVGYNGVTITGDISARNNSFTVKNLTATDVVAANYVAYLSTVTFPVSVTAQQFIDLGIDQAGVLTQNFTVGESLTSTTITATVSLSTPRLSANRILATDQFLPVTGRVSSNISPKNILVWTEDFTRTTWGTLSADILSNNTTAPDGTNTADKFVENGSFGWPVFETRDTERSLYVTGDRTYTYSIYAKADQRRYLGIDVREIATTLNPLQLDTPRVAAIFDVQAGTIIQPLSANFASSVALSAGINPVGNGWYRIGMTFIPNATPTLPRDPSALRIRHSLFGSEPNTTTRTRFLSVVEPPLNRNRDVDFNTLGYNTTLNNGLWLWGAQLEYNNRVTEYQRRDERILPDIYANTITGKVPIDPALTNPVTYTADDELRVDRDAVLILGIKPSDSFSTNNSNQIRALTGDWDWDHNADDFGVSKPFFKNFQGVTDYIFARGLFGNTLNILVYEDIEGNFEPVNLSPWPTDHPKYNPAPTTPSDISGLRTARYRRFGGGGSTAYESDTYSTEWLGANYPALTAAGLRGGTYCWRAGIETDRDNTIFWTPGAVIRTGRNIRFGNIVVQGLHNIKPRVGNSHAQPPAYWNQEIPPSSGYTPQYKAYYTKEKPFDQRSPKIIMRNYICFDRLKNFEDGFGVKTTTNGGGGFFGNGNGDPSLWLKSKLKDGFWFDRSHTVNFNTSPATALTIKNLILEQESNASQQTPALWAYGSMDVRNVVVVNRGSCHNFAWSSGVYEEGYISAPSAKNRYFGEYQIDPYFLTPGTWPTTNWTNVIGAKGKDYYPGFALALVGNMPYQANSPHPWRPTSMYTYFVTSFDFNASSEFIDPDERGRQFGRASYLQSALILDGEWCAQSVICNTFTKQRQTYCNTTGIILKGDRYKFNYYHTLRGSDHDIYHAGDTTYATLTTNPNNWFWQYINYYPIRFNVSLTNLFTTSVGIAPWTFGGFTPQPSAYPGTATYRRSLEYGTWDTRWSIPITNPLDPYFGGIDVTGFLSPTRWAGSTVLGLSSAQRRTTWAFQAPNTGTVYAIPTASDNPIPTNYPSNTSNGEQNRYTLSIDGYNVRLYNWTVTTAGGATLTITPTAFVAEERSSNLILSGVAAWEFDLTAPSTTTLTMPAGPRMPGGSNNYKVTVLRQGQAPTVLSTTSYTVNSATRQLTFTPAITTQLVRRAFDRNILTSPEDFNFSTRSAFDLNRWYGWQRFGLSLTPHVCATPAEFGLLGTRADALSCRGDIRCAIFQNFPISATNAQYVASVWLRADTPGQQIRLGVDQSCDNFRNARILTLTDNWVRYGVTFTSSGTANGAFFIDNITSNTNSCDGTFTSTNGRVGIWGAEVEPGTLSSAYIPVNKQLYLDGTTPPTGTVANISAFNIPVQIIVNQLSIAQNSNVVLQAAIGSEYLVDNIINSIVQYPPYWIRTNDNRFILSSYVDINDLDNYRQWFRIPSPLNPSLTSTLVYYTTGAQLTADR
jgi:hypothetical protein